jgi:predicted nucleic acid-binding protein
VKEVFADANLFLRFFAKDDEAQHRKAVNFFRQASEGRVGIVTGPPVLFEVAWTLRSAYDQPREKVLDVLRVIAALPAIRLTDAALVSEALGLAERSGQEFADAYIAASAAREDAAIGTFNKRHFERLGVELHPL